MPLWERLREVGLPKDFNGIAPNEEEVFKIVFYSAFQIRGAHLIPPVLNY